MVEPAIDRSDRALLDHFNSLNAAPAEGVGALTVGPGQDGLMVEHTAGIHIGPSKAINLGTDQRKLTKHVVIWVCDPGIDKLLLEMG